MSGVWVFKNGVLRLIETPGGRDSGSGSGGYAGRGQQHFGGSWRRKVLVHLPTEEVITSHEMLESRLRELGWEHYPSTPELIQYHKRSSVHLISVPRDFSRLTSVHMFDIVVKCRNVFEVRDA